MSSQKQALPVAHSASAWPCEAGAGHHFMRKAGNSKKEGQGWFPAGMAPITRVRSGEESKRSAGRTSRHQPAHRGTVSVCHILALNFVREVKGETQPVDREVGKKNDPKNIIMTTGRADVLTKPEQQKQSEKGRFIYECAYPGLV